MDQIVKNVMVGNQSVQAVATKIVRSDGSVIVRVEATAGKITHTQNWTLPHDNPNYSQEQAQKDFETHCNKVATAAMGRVVADSVSDNLK